MNQPVFISVAPSIHKTTLDEAGPCSKRAIRKANLMAFNPTCSNCEIALTADPFMENSAHLVADSLSCPKCVKNVRKASKPPWIDRTLTMSAIDLKQLERIRQTAARFIEHEKRMKIKKRLLAVNPACSCCGNSLDGSNGNQQSAHLVIDRLSCAACVKQVLQVCRLEREAKGGYA